MAETSIENELDIQPYQPSWIDRFNSWVEGLPVRSWIFHALFSAVLILVQVLFLWLDGGLFAVELLPIIVFNGIATPFLLLLILILDDQALNALESMRSILDMTEQEVNAYRYSLANMPFLAPLVAGLVLTIMVILTPLITVAPLRYAALEQLPVFTVVFHIIDKSSAFLFGVVLYHTIRQLRIVNTINSNYVQVNLFYLKPLQSFSRLTASTALGLIVYVYLWMFINPELLNDPLLFGYLLVFTILGITVFAWPLWGIHKLMRVEKDRALNEVDLHFEEIFSKFNQRIKDEDFLATEKLNGTITSLEIQQNKIKSIPTWPWRPETVRSLFSVIALPIVLRIVQFLVDQAFGW